MDIQNLNLIYKAVKWFESLSKRQKNTITTNYYIILNSVTLFMFIFIVGFVILDFTIWILKKKQKKNFLDVKELYYFSLSKNEKINVLNNYIHHYKRLNKIYILENISELFSNMLLILPIFTGIWLMVPLGYTLMLHFNSLVSTILILILVTLAYGIMYFRALFYKSNYKKRFNSIEEKIIVNKRFIKKMKIELKKLK